MHSHLIFHNPPALSHEVVVETLERALEDRVHEPEAADVMVGTALYDDDREFVEYWCMQVGTRAVSGSPLLGLAGLCLGTLLGGSDNSAMRHLHWHEPLSARAEMNPADVVGRALDGLDDVRSFLRLRPA
ncbi:hypothetical protein ACFWCF_18525 [Rhodococcus sp. NPDC060090]|uniref:hypothetical protein n=1 Tax=Rhodococcus sp. NPDC060090 TaxID=3347056 RepID=UPI003655CD16